MTNLGQVYWCAPVAGAVRYFVCKCSKGYRSSVRWILDCVLLMRCFLRRGTVTCCLGHFHVDFCAENMHAVPKLVFGTACIFSEQIHYKKYHFYVVALASRRKMCRLIETPPWQGNSMPLQGYHAIKPEGISPLYHTPPNPFIMRCPSPWYLFNPMRKYIEKR